ncbi:Tyrosine kinase-like (TKL) protein [Besnoitia besnoiti]|uniref:non-specific serine/threonine protein kinase n=1 Tax=Besnoitia besnoiti TaxID=94643 RepID=A0A2A9MN11_BESBE|nr:Tyrosine kinase-like (TKL) protein [Besnoitia besnoiti]PFH37223.1 Tyrosine kinase-like (TKL) protein [Besnoitia besnoiti]
MQTFKQFCSNWIPPAFHFGQRQYVIGNRTLREEKPISEGGYAFVSIVRDVATGELFALKRILCQDRERYQLAREEAKLLDSLPPHRNVVGYYGSAIESIPATSSTAAAREVLLLLELCDGGHVLDLLERHQGQLKEAWILHILKDITSGIAHLHAQSVPISHRDLKIENVLCCPRPAGASTGAAGGGSGDFDGEGQTPLDFVFKLCDFGSSHTRQLDTATCSREELLKAEDEIARNTTLMYRPPEMVDVYRRLPIGPQVDMWMLGCILYTLCFFRHPFQEESSLAIANANYSIPSNDYSPELISLLQQLLSVNPSDRPTSEELLALLESEEGFRERMRARGGDAEPNGQKKDKRTKAGKKEAKKEAKSDRGKKLEEKPSKDKRRHGNAESSPWDFQSADLSPSSPSLFYSAFQGAGAWTAEAAWAPGGTRGDSQFGGECGRTGETLPPWRAFADAPRGPRDGGAKAEAFDRSEGSTKAPPEAEDPFFRSCGTSHFFQDETSPAHDAAQADFFAASWESRGKEADGAPPSTAAFAVSAAAFAAPDPPAACALPPRRGAADPALNAFACFAQAPASENAAADAPATSSLAQRASDRGRGGGETSNAREARAGAAEGLTAVASAAEDDTREAQGFASWTATFDDACASASASPPAATASSPSPGLCRSPGGSFFRCVDAPTTSSQASAASVTQSASLPTASRRAAPPLAASSSFGASSRGASGTGARSSFAPLAGAFSHSFPQQPSSAGSVSHTPSRTGDARAFSVPFNLFGDFRATSAAAAEATQTRSERA